MNVKKLAPRSRSSPRRRQVLIVDDEPGTVDVLAAVLDDAQFEIVRAAHGKEALAQLAGALPDVVLLDFVMPVLDGCETLRALRSDERLAKLGVIMMSGIPESMVKRRCRGYDAFLRKPFSLEELLGAVNEVLER